MVLVDLHVGALARVEDGLGERGEVDGEFFVFETAAVEGGLAAVGVVVFAVFAVFLAREGRWGAGEGGGLLC